MNTIKKRLVRSSEATSQDKEKLLTKDDIESIVNSEITNNHNIVELYIQDALEKYIYAIEYEVCKHLRKYWDEMKEEAKKESFLITDQLIDKKCKEYIIGNIKAITDSYEHVRISLL